MTDKFIEFVGGNPQGFWVICNETGDIYSSLSDAAKAFDVDVRRMSDHVLGRRGFVRGKYTFSIVQTPKYNLVRSWCMKLEKCFNHFQKLLESITLVGHIFLSTLKNNGRFED